MTKRKKDELAGHLEDICSDTEIFGAKAPCPARFEKSPRNTRVAIVSGENGGGKTLALRALAGYFRRAQPDVEVIQISMRTRCASGFERVFIYAGDESEDSTGALSAGAALKALAAARTKDEPHIVLLDEPDIGLSEGWAAALGEEIACFCKDMPEKTLAIVIVSHSRALLQPIAALNPHSLRVGSDLRPLAEWLDKGPLPRKTSLEEMKTEAKKRWVALTRILEKRRRKAA